jgi:hypothetical protein
MFIELKVTASMLELVTERKSERLKFWTAERVRDGLE